VFPRCAKIIYTLRHEFLEKVSKQRNICRTKISAALQMGAKSLLTALQLFLIQKIRSYCVLSVNIVEILPENVLFYCFGHVRTLFSPHTKQRTFFCVQKKILFLYFKIHTTYACYFQYYRIDSGKIRCQFWNPNKSDFGAKSSNR